MISLPILPNFQLFTRIASANAKGLILGDFHKITYNPLKNQFISPIIEFQCFSNDLNQQLILQWSIDHTSHSYIEKYILYYSDSTQTNDDFIRIKTIPTDSLTINHHSTYNVLKYNLNTSSLNLNFNQYHILHLYLSIIDENENQLPITLPPKYCLFTRKSGKNNIDYISFLFVRESDRLVL